MHHAKSSEQTKQKKSRMSFGTLSLSCGYKIPWTPPAYGADWANFPWTHLSLRGIPTRECFRYLFFIITSRCDTTDHNGTESSDAPHDARRISTGTSTNKGRCPTMMKPIRGGIIIEDRGCLWSDAWPSSRSRSKIKSQHKFRTDRTLNQEVKQYIPAMMSMIFELYCSLSRAGLGPHNRTVITKFIRTLWAVTLLRFAARSKTWSDLRIKYYCCLIRPNQRWNWRYAGKKNSLSHKANMPHHAIEASHASTFPSWHTEGLSPPAKDGPSSAWDEW